MSPTITTPPQERFCAQCGARKQPESTSEVVLKYCTSCGAAQYTLPKGQAATSSEEPQKIGRFSQKNLIVAICVVLALGSASYGTTRLFIEKPAPGKAPNASQQAASGDGSANGSADASGNAPASPMSKVSPEQQAKIALLSDSLAKSPKDGGILLRLANAWYDVNAFFQAEQHYARYLNEFNPQDVAARVDYAYTILRQGRADEAIAETKKALEYDPKRIEAMYNLGVMYYGKKEFQTSISWFEKCAAASPNTEIASSANEIIERIKKEMAQNQGS